MQIIYPNNFINLDTPDEDFEPEFLCARNSGINCIVLDSEKASLGEYKFAGAFEQGAPVIWRGWMLDAEEYRQLFRAVMARGAKMLESPDDYTRNHHITGWYEQCKAFTPETVITTPDADYDDLINRLQWPAYFVKDFVKSLTTSRGSVAHNAEEIREVIRLCSFFPPVVWDS